MLKAEAVQKQKKIEEEEKAGTIVFKVIHNDNDRFNLEHLVNLKNIFGLQVYHVIPLKSRGISSPALCPLVFLWNQQI